MEEIKIQLSNKLFNNLSREKLLEEKVVRLSKQNQELLQILKIFTKQQEEKDLIF